MGNKKTASKHNMREKAILEKENHRSAITGSEEKMREKSITTEGQGYKTLGAKRKIRELILSGRKMIGERKDWG